MINASLRDGCFPQSQKRAIVTPLLKKPASNVDELKNYCAVSNLTFMSKLVEMVVLARLVRHLETHGLMPRLQSAYRPHHSTETALLKIVSDIFVATDRQQVTLLGLLDLLDCVDHDILMMESPVGSTYELRSHSLLSVDILLRRQGTSSASPDLLTTGLSCFSAAIPSRYTTRDVCPL